MNAMEKEDKNLIFATLFAGVFSLCILFLAALWRQCLRLLRRRRSFQQDQSDNDNDDNDAAVRLEDILQLETNRRESRELQEEVKSLRETQAHVRSILQSLQSKIEEKDAASKALNDSRAKIE
jgi:flagellar biosynthesis/type III secretory pathway M-ring protein FliF/YscJ